MSLSSVGLSLFIFAAILAMAAVWAGVAIAFLALCWEVFLFIRAGLEPIE